MAQIHELKTDPRVFELVACGSKKFEIRKNDRDFKSGDTLRLRKTAFTGEEMKAGKPLEYLNKMDVLVTHIMTGPKYGLQEGWCLMSIASLKDWQPIETVPKDGQEVILKVKRRAGIDGCCLVGHYMPGGHCIEDHPPIGQGWYFWNGCMFDSAAEPLEWMPLPA